MSLRLKLIALFAAVLASTMGVAAWLGGRIAARTVEGEIRERTLETGRALAAEFARAASWDEKSTNERLSGRLRSDPGLRSIELAINWPQGVRQTSNNISRVEMTPDGVEVQKSSGPAEIPLKPDAVLLEGAEGRFWSVSVPARLGHSPARITVEASLTEADRLVDSERRVFVWVTAAACAFLILAAHLLLLRLIGRPIGKLAQAMSEAERGRLDTSVDESGRDELALLAKGFNAMLGRIRSFSAVLERRVDEAVEDVERKNRALAELNDLLVAAQRDLNAKERLAALGQLSGTLAHELGNPLNVISGNLQLLARRGDLASDARDDLQLLQDEVARITGIIRRFLDSTRGLKPAPEPVELATLIHEALDLSLSVEARARLQVTAEVEPGLEDVELDPGLVRHVITNFITNAVDAMPRGGRLALRAARQGDELLISLSDTGEGMSPEERKHIFEPFYTTKARGKGTGLGLSICREIALALKGHIDVESQKGEGSTFMFRLPCPHAANAPAAPEEMPAASKT